MVRGHDISSNGTSLVYWGMLTELEHVGVVRLVYRVTQAERHRNTGDSDLKCGALCVVVDRQHC